MFIKVAIIILSVYVISSSNLKILPKEYFTTFSSLEYYKILSLLWDNFT